MEIVPENTSVADKVLQLTVELADTQNRKKSTVKAYNEEIKRLKAEIAELIEPKKETEDLE